MKLYALFTLLALAGAASLGYWNGKGTAQAGFVSACLDSRFAVVYDQGSDAHRHFHCFELEAVMPEEKASNELSEGQLVL